MCHVLKYLIDSSVPLIDAENLEGIHKIPPEDWQDLVKDLKGSVFSSFLFFSSYINIDCDEINYSVILTRILGSIVTKPAMKPCSIRVDQLDRDVSSHPNSLYPDIIHFGIRPPQLSYAGSKKYVILIRSFFIVD